MSRLVVIPNIEGVQEPMASILRALKQNAEVMSGQTGDDKTERAVKFGDVKVADLDPQQSTPAAGDPPTQAEFDKLVADFTALRERYNYLVALLRGETMGG